MPRSRPAPRCRGTPNGAGTIRSDDTAFAPHVLRDTPADRVALLLVAAAFGPPVDAQQLPTASEAVAKLRAVTNRDPAVQTVDIDGHYTLGDQRVVFRYSYRAPDPYSGLQAFGSPPATFFAAEDDRVLFYDPVVGEVAGVTNVLPGIRWAVVNRAMQVGYSVNRRAAGASQTSASSVVVDVPSIVNESSARIDRVEQAAGGGYQLVGQTIQGDPILLTVDSSGSMVTDIRVGTEKGKVFIRMRVNAVPPVKEAVIPTERAVSQSIAVKQTAFPDDMAGAMRFLARMSLPLAVLGPAGRKNFESASGEKPDWAAAQANMKGDAEKLRKAFPSPA